LDDGRFRVAKVANFSLSHLHLAPPLRVTLFEFWAIVWRCLHDPVPFQ